MQKRARTFGQFFFANAISYDRGFWKRTRKKYLMKDTNRKIAEEALSAM